MSIPFYSLKSQHREIQEESRDAFSAVYNGSQFILGDHVSTFEGAFATYLGARHCTGVGNGFDALFIALKALGIGPGDEVIVPAHTCIATWLAVSMTGAALKAVDANPETLLIDTNKIDNAISGRTRAIVPVHLYGLPCDMQAIKAIASAHQLLIVEDNAQAIGAAFDGRKTGTWGNCNAFSFYPTKNLGALGDGGAVVTDDEGTDHLVRAFRNYGARYPNVNEVKGINSRLDELQAAILNIKLKRLEKWNDQRRQINDWYREQLRGLDMLAMPVLLPLALPACHIFPVHVEKRDQLKQHLTSHGIETMVHYPVPSYRQKAYVDFNVNDGFPVADRLTRTELSLPIWPGLGENEVTEICDRVKAFLKA